MKPHFQISPENRNRLSPMLSPCQVQPLIAQQLQHSTGKLYLKEN